MREAYRALCVRIAYWLLSQRYVGNRSIETAMKAEAADALIINLRGQIQALRRERDSFKQKAIMKQMDIERLVKGW